MLAVFAAQVVDLQHPAGFKTGAPRRGDVNRARAVNTVRANARRTIAPRCCEDRGSDDCGQRRFTTKAVGRRLLGRGLLEVLGERTCSGRRPKPTKRAVMP